MLLPSNQASRIELSTTRLPNVKRLADPSACSSLASVFSFIRRNKARIRANNTLGLTGLAT